MWLWKTCVQRCGKACVQWCGCEKPVCNDVPEKLVCNDMWKSLCAVMWLWKTSVQWCEKPVCSDAEKLVCSDVVVKNLCTVMWKRLCAVTDVVVKCVQWCGKACVQWRGCEKPVCSYVVVKIPVCGDVLWKSLCSDVLWKSLCAVMYRGKTCVQWCIVETPATYGGKIGDQWRIVEKPVCRRVMYGSPCFRDTHARELTGDRLLTERSQSERKINHAKNSKLRAGGAQQAVLANSLFRCTLGEPRVLPLFTPRRLNYVNNSFTVSLWRDFNLW